MSRFLRLTKIVLARGQYYRFDPNTMATKEVLKRWAEDGDKVYDDTYMVPIYELYYDREYKWTRDKARLSPEEWDRLKEDLQRNGWDPNQPAHMFFGKNGVMKVGEGNHRLAIAYELGIRTIPVMFHFWQNVQKEPMPW